MHFQIVHVILLLVSLFLSMCILIAATKYASDSRMMVEEKGSWLGLCSYVGFIPLMSLVYTITHMALLHFKILPSFSPAASVRRRRDPNPTPPSVSLALGILMFTFIYSLTWLAEAILCTTCELAPIAAGTQGIVPAWCPQSRFHDRGDTVRANMLASLAIARDSLVWLATVVGFCMCECSRRGWMAARIIEADNDRAGAVRAYDPSAPLPRWPKVDPSLEIYEMNEFPSQPKNANTINPDTKTGSAWNKFVVNRTEEVKVNLKVGIGYDTRV